MKNDDKEQTDDSIILKMKHTMLNDANEKPHDKMKQACSKLHHRNTVQYSTGQMNQMYSMLVTMIR